jgi:hypothetical protein
VDLSEFKQKLNNEYYDDIHHFLDEINLIVNRYKRFEKFPSAPLLNDSMVEVKVEKIEDVFKYLRDELDLVIQAIDDKYFPYTNGIYIKQQIGRMSI